MTYENCVIFSHHLIIVNVNTLLLEVLSLPALAVRCGVVSDLISCCYFVR